MALLGMAVFHASVMGFCEIWNRRVTHFPLSAWLVKLCQRFARENKRPRGPGRRPGLTLDSLAAVARVLGCKLDDLVETPSRDTTKK
jgi:hypothetical protein